jgi:steroid 5-alpha reductase family enzyme
VSTVFDWGAFALSLPLTAIAVVVVMGATFGTALRLGRHSVVDVAWGLGFVAVAGTSYALGAGHGDPTRRLMVLLLTTVWGVRLAVRIGMRSRGAGEDRRYAALLDRAPGNRAVFALQRIYLTQGVTLWFVSLPVQVASFEPAGSKAVMALGVLLWLVGFGFESVGDLQLSRFRADPASDGTVLDTGLWRYTRHPNYFGDACVWWGLSLVAFSAWPGVLTALSPVLMTWLLAKGTGKPMLERDISDRRPGYRSYLLRTSGFLPLPPRSR